MNGEMFDWVALIRAIIIGVIISIAVSVIGDLIGKGRRSIWIRVGVAVGLFAIVTIFLTWPSIIKVPNLAGLAQARAEAVLIGANLVPDPKPQYFDGAKAGCVIPGSQQPPAGMEVRTGTYVSFGIAQNEQTSLTPDNTHRQVSVTIFSPKSGQTAVCKKGGDGLHRLSVTGTFTGQRDGFQLLLWAKPIDPPSDQSGWYLQRPRGNGISSLAPDGTWEGIVQIGNAQFPPSKGNTVSVMVTVNSATEAADLLAQPGVVNVVNLPGIASAEAKNIVLDPQ